MSALSTTSVEPARGNHDDPEYDSFLARIQARFDAHLALGGSALFTTDAIGLFDAYLAAMPDADRQYHNCHACRRFLEVYGGLVTIDEAGASRPAIWDEADAPDHYKPAIAAVARLVRRAKVTGVFLSALPVWGQPVTGCWHHFAVKPPDAIVHRRALLTAGQAMAEKLEDFRNVSRALGEFDHGTLTQAMTLLESDAMYRAEKVIGPARWLRDLHAVRAGVQGKDRRDNLVWRAVASAPAGFCHPRSSMVGALLEDIAAGMDFGEVSRRFAAMMHPLQYQRPQAAPSAGNIAEAEKLVEKLGIARSLDRRFARLDEVEAIWRPAPPRGEAATGGVFGHLKPKGSTTSPGLIIVPPPAAMTWEKFRRTVLPAAESIEFHARPGQDSYAAFVTAEHADAPPILQWDRPERRNPVSWYFKTGGSAPQHWGLVAGSWVAVNAITLKPSRWGDDPAANAHQGDGVMFLLEGARDSQEGGNALFPEILKAELRAVRATIEAHSRSAKLGGREEASACGIMLDKGGRWDARFRVRTGGVTLEYRLDRWD